MLSLYNSSLPSSNQDPITRTLITSVRYSSDHSLFVPADGETTYTLDSCQASKMTLEFSPVDSTKSIIIMTVVMSHNFHKL